MSRVHIVTLQLAKRTATTAADIRLEREKKNVESGPKKIIIIVPTCFRGLNNFTRPFHTPPRKVLKSAPAGPN